MTFFTLPLRASPCSSLLLKLDFLLFFVEASPETRARRRFAELQAKDPNVRFEEVLEALKQRDEQDRNRSEAPLCKAVDAILVDTSNLNVEQVLSVLEHHLRPFLLAESS